jgi:hypothetical protein
MASKFLDRQDFDLALDGLVEGGEVVSTKVA